MTTQLTTPLTLSQTPARNDAAHTTTHPLPPYHTATPQPTPATLAQAFNTVEPALRGSIIKDITTEITRAQGDNLSPWVIAGMRAAVTALTEDLAPAPTSTPLDLTAHLETMGVTSDEAPVVLVHASAEARMRCAKVIATGRTTRRGAEGVFFNMGIEMAITTTVGV